MDFDAVAAQRVYEALQQASSQDPSILKPAEQKLKEWETQQGFYVILMNIYSNQDVDANVRWLAVVCLKNGVDRYWRKNIINSISDNEKVSLRNSLLNNFREPVNQIATQMAVLIAKVARLDFPREWPELMPLLLANVSSTDELLQHRTLLVLHQVIKSLCSKRLTGDRKIFQDLSASIFPFILEQWDGHMCAAISKLTEQSTLNEAAAVLEKALLLLKVLRKLTVSGFKKPHESSHVQTFLGSLFERTKTILEYRKNLKSIGASPAGLIELLEKTAVNLNKVLVVLLEFHPYSYVDLLQPTLEFTFYYVFTTEGEQFLFERLLILCLNRLKNIFICPEFKPPRVARLNALKGVSYSYDNFEQTEARRATEIKKEFFTNEIVTVMGRELIIHFFRLTEEDLRLWDSDPETFATNEGGECRKYNLRPCTESLFLSLFHDHSKVLCPVLLELVSQNHAPVSPDDLNAILSKDAVYNAVGLAAFEMYDEINFDKWFMTTLSEELKVKSGNYRVIRRRVAWLLGQWTGVKLSSENRPALYAAMLPLLQPGEDMAVRLTASTTIKKAMDDFDFETEQFLNFLEPSVGLLFTLLKDAHECDSKMHVLYVLSFIIERMGVTIRPYSNTLIQYLPLLWNESAEHNMLRCAIVSTLVHLIRALGSVGQNSDVEQFLLQVIQLSTDVRQDAHVYLMEDGLELWFAVLENTSRMSPNILHLFRNMPALLDGSSEHLKICLYIIQAYTLLGPEEFLQMYGEVVVRLCMYLVTDMRPEGIVMVMKVLELCLRIKPAQAMPLIRPMLPGILQNVCKAEDLPTVMSMYLSILARVLLFSTEPFQEAAAIVSRSIGESAENIVGRAFDVWLDKLNLVTQHERRKLLGLAFASLLTSGSSVVYDRFCGFLLGITEVLNDITRPSDEPGLYIDSLMYTGIEGDDSSCDETIEITAHNSRRKQLASVDPVHTYNLQSYFQQQISTLVSQVGVQHFNELMSTVDVETLENVREYLPTLQL